jgi:hypothetical protein
MTDLGAKQVIPLDRPQPAPDVAVGRRDFPEHVDEEADGVVGHVGGEYLAGAGHEDAPARALGKVDVVQAGGGGHDAAEVRRCVKEGGVYADGAAADDEGSSRGLGLRRGGGGEESREYQFMAFLFAL